ncbi:MAG: LamG domain-containing protein [Sedimentisphaerales bacterium]|nr:LamG domain-containing protein [Sedimentisphaerales bacterium]
MYTKRIIGMLVVMVISVNVVQATLSNPADLPWEGVVNVSDADTISYSQSNTFYWTLNEDAGGVPANVTYSGSMTVDTGQCLVGVVSGNAITSILTIRTTLGAPGVVDYVGNIYRDPGIGIRLGHIDDVGIINIENGNTLKANGLAKYTNVSAPSSNAVVNINDGHVFCYTSVVDRNMAGITVNIASGSSLRIMADILNVYNAATYAANTTGSDGIAGSVTPEPGSTLSFVNGGDYEGNPTVLITAQAGAPIIETQPVDAMVNVGETAVFTIEAINSLTGDATGLHYNWYEYVDGVSDIPVGTDAPMLSLPGVDVSYDGKEYYCDVYNVSFTVTSDKAYLTVRRIIAHWQFEDDMVDIIGGWTGEFVDPNELNPTPTPAYDPDGINGKAFQFAGDTTQIRIINSNDGSFDFYPYGLTVSCWLKTTEAQTEAVAYPVLYGNPSGLGGDPDVRGWFILTNSDNTCGGKIQGAASVITTPPLIADGQWHMLTLTHAGGAVAVYADGVVVDGLTDATPEFSLNESLLIMGAMLTGERSYKGSLDDVRIYNYPLNPFEVATVYTDFMPGATICAEAVPNDLNGDCIVDLADFAIFASTWLNCNEVPTCLTSNPQ